MTCINLVFLPEKLISNDKPQLDTWGFECGFCLLSSSSFCGLIYGTNVQIERTWKDTESLFVVELVTSLALLLRRNPLREFRY